MISSSNLTKSHHLCLTNGQLGLLHKALDKFLDTGFRIGAPQQQIHSEEDCRRECHINVCSPSDPLPIRGDAGAGSLLPQLHSARQLAEPGKAPAGDGLQL